MIDNHRDRSPFWQWPFLVQAVPSEDSVHQKCSQCTNGADQRQPKQEKQPGRDLARAQTAEEQDEGCATRCPTADRAKHDGDVERGPATL